MRLVTLCLVVALAGGASSSPAATDRIAHPGHLPVGRAAPATIPLRMFDPGAVRLQHPLPPPSPSYAPSPGGHPSIALAPSFQYQDLHGLGQDGRGAACAVLRMMWCYTQRDLDGFASCLAPSFRYASDDPDVIADAPQGFDLEDELSSAAHLFDGVVKRGQALPAADEIRVQVESIDAAPTGEDESLRHGVRVVCTGVTLSIAFDDGTRLRTSAARDEFLVLGQGDGRRRHWLIAGWREITRDGATSPPTAPAVPSEAPARVAALVHLAIAPAHNPARGRLEVMASLPATTPAVIELYDVAGRRVAASAPPPLLGTHAYEIAEARGLPPGHYLLRLRQSGASATAKVVLMP